MVNAGKRDKACQFQDMANAGKQGKFYWVKVTRSDKENDITNFNVALLLN